MPLTYKAIASVTVGASASASISFNSIPQTFTDLVVLASIRSNVGSVNEPFVLGFNNNTASAYTNRSVGGDGSTASSQNIGASAFISYNGLLTHVGNGATANTFGNMSIYISNYGGANFKSVSIDAVSETNAANTNLGLGAALWSNTAAITSIQMLVYSGTAFVQHSSFTLYGINNS